jgi:hypothetical protein
MDYFAGLDVSVKDTSVLARVKSFEGLRLRASPMLCFGC